MNTREQPDNPILLFRAQGDKDLTQLQPLLSHGVALQRDVGFHLGGARVLVAVEENSRHGVVTLGRTPDQQVAGERVVLVTTDRIRVLTLLVGLTNLLREETNEKMHTNLIKCVINFEIQVRAVMAMLASFSTANSRRGLQLLPSHPPLL